MRWRLGGDWLSTTMVAPGTMPSFTSTTVPTMVPVCGSGAEICWASAPSLRHRQRITRQSERLIFTAETPFLGLDSAAAASDSEKNHPERKDAKDAPYRTVCLLRSR